MNNSPSRPMTSKEAYARLTALCARTEYCLSDIRRKMEHWQFSADTAEDAAVKQNLIDRLVSERYVDERRYAQAFARDKFRYNHWGSLRIRQELRRRQIDEGLANEAIALIADDDKMDILRGLIEQKKKSVKGRSSFEVNQKLMRFALSRGFPMDDIRRVIDQTPFDDDF